jgi:hypothetical protein
LLVTMRSSKNSWKFNAFFIFFLEKSTVHCNIQKFA